MAKVNAADKIERAVKALGLDKEFPHRHDFFTCYGYDGHRSDLACDHIETPHPCHRCEGTGKYTFYKDESSCPRCNGSGLSGGNFEAQKKLLKYLERDEALDRLLAES
jgi:hypothetical protein